MPKVSVVVPIYRVERYIERCARSLFEQTLDDMEYIFVDDCSPDNSVNVLNSVLHDYPNRKEQTVILHHESNKGLPIARQTGIKVAGGEYIAHCDSDDWVELDLYERLYQESRTEHLDVVVFNCVITDGVKELSRYISKPITDGAACIDAMMHRRMWWSLCNKMFKRTVYHNEISYPQDAMGEDMCLTLQLFYYCHKIGYVDKFYYYYTNPFSIIQQVSEDKCLLKFRQIVKNVEIVRNFYTLRGLADRFSRGIRYLEYNAKFTLLPILGKKQYYLLWRNTYKRCEWKVFCDMQSSLKERVRAGLAFVGLYPLPRNRYSD